MNVFYGKKLLVLGGSGQNCKIVDSAKKLGIYTIVTDRNNLSISPAKRIADDHWEIDYNDISFLAEKCRNEKINGVLACFDEYTQYPYYRLCSELNLPCFTTREQLDVLTNKKKFKAMCREKHVGTIIEYNKEDINEKNNIFPVIIKPVDNGGSKGQTICISADETIKAIENSLMESKSKDYVIEKYLGERETFQVTYYFKNGTAYLIRTADGYKGTADKKLDKVTLCSLSPSIHTKEYIETTHEKVVSMLSSLGVTDGPVMLQGFYDSGNFLFFDPGRRFPGTDYEVLFSNYMGMDVIVDLICFALSIKVPPLETNNQMVYLQGKIAIMLFICIGAGVIGRIEGVDELMEDQRIIRINQKFFVGDKVDWTYTTKQRIFDICLLCDDMSAVKDAISKLQRDIRIYDTNGREMTYGCFDVLRLPASV